MKVIFLQDVPNVAQAGQVRDVADGYARNYLIPRKLAAMAQPQAVRQIESKVKKQEIRLAGEMTELAGQIEGKEVSLKAKAGAKDKLYGSITSADIAAELKNVTGIEVDKRKIELEEPIRQLGSYEIAIKLGKDITPKVRVTVTEEEAEEKPPKKEEAPKKEKKAAKKERKAPAKEEKAAKEKKKTAKKAAKEPEAEKKTTRKAAKTTKAAEKKPKKAAKTTKAAEKKPKKAAKVKKEKKTE
jgi:large subunit ribosomal protein L9